MNDRETVRLDVEYIRPSRAAEILGVCPKTVRRMAADGAIGAVRTQGGHRRYVLDDVMAVHARRTCQDGTL